MGWRPRRLLRRSRISNARTGSRNLGRRHESVWTEEERLLIRLADELHDTATISGDLWQALAPRFTTEQIFELIALAGFYHTVSFFGNGLKLQAEPYAASPPLV